MTIEDLALKFRALNNVIDPNENGMFTEAIQKKRRWQDCALHGCENHLTFHKGPGSLMLCREHQLIMREYGGFARLDRPWTFWKQRTCSKCGHDPRNNPEVAKLTEPARSVLAMSMLIVDHISPGRGDKYGHHEVNNPENLQTLCMECNWIKTSLEGDFCTEWHENKG